MRRIVYTIVTVILIIFILCASEKISRMAFYIFNSEYDPIIVIYDEINESEANGYYMVYEHERIVSLDPPKTHLEGIHYIPMEKILKPYELYNGFLGMADVVKFDNNGEFVSSMRNFIYIGGIVEAFAIVLFLILYILLMFLSSYKIMLKKYSKRGKEKTLSVLEYKFIANYSKVKLICLDESFNEYRSYAYSPYILSNINMESKNLKVKAYFIGNRCFIDCETLKEEA